MTSSKTVYMSLEYYISPEKLPDKQKFASIFIQETCLNMHFISTKIINYGDHWQLAMKDKSLQKCIYSGLNYLLQLHSST